jgi:hypothetical protein
MKNIKQLCLSLLLGSAFSVASLVHAADTKTYQVTGPVLEVTPATVTVQKGDEKWQIARDKSTKMTGDLKVGSKVTIYYRMVAVEIENKDKAETKDSKTKK